MFFRVALDVLFCLSCSFFFCVWSRWEIVVLINSLYTPYTHPSVRGSEIDYLSFLGPALPRDSRRNIFDGAQ